FLTVDHIMTCAPPGSTYYYYGKVPDEVCQPAVEIERVASDPGRDLYLGKICRDSLQSVELSSDTVRPGDSVCLSGYPLHVLSVNDQGRFIGNIRRYWQPTFVIDASRAVIQGRAYDGYIVGHPCFSGMSGGPVFDRDGKVRGMAVATLTRTVAELDDSPTVIKNGIVVDVEHIRAFIDEHRPALSSSRT
ncbi:MAG: serine protease, partial [Chloroflexi bacterium]|nr:serine protease [Chloroflexota bacterium]